ncbi:MAG: glutamate--cysteine ligase [Chloroflexota bacterium]
MNQSVEHQLKKLEAAEVVDLLRGGLKGLEKESLRATYKGQLAQTAHYRSLGSALTHPNITTDYSEALLELVTGPHADPIGALAELDVIHRFTYQNIGDEVLWNASMPCIVHGEASIPIAKYGSSNKAIMKEIYRIGLGHRYGRVMQVIAGIHFNYSLPEPFWPHWQKVENDTSPLVEYKSQKYMGLVRNYLRADWLILYLFGASPTLCKSFFTDMPNHNLDILDDATVYSTFGTSLRMSDLGYQNKAAFKVSRDSMASYVNSLDKAVFTPYPPFEKIGLKENGAYKQLNTNILQIANEFYSAIRPKQPMQPGERPTTALRKRGIAYVEVRSIDINPIEPVGVSPAQLRFLEALLITCALAESPSIDPNELNMIRHNQLQVAREGRRPGLMLQRMAGKVDLKEWAREIFDAMYPVCAILDENEPYRPYTIALDRQRQKVFDPDLTPSAKMLAELRHFGESFYQYGMRKSLTLQKYFLDRPLPDDLSDIYTEKAKLSLSRQQQIEEKDSLSFEAYLQAYFGS